MSKRKSLRVYMAGAMEAEKNLGAGWRAKLTPKLEELSFTVLNPCEFEPQQLEGLRPSRLPDKFKARDGSIVKPSHWHELKLSERNSDMYRRFKRYMQKIVNYDIDLVTDGVDIVVCYWCQNAARGAGTHSELTTAFKFANDGNGIPIYVVEEKDSILPGWLEGIVTEVFPNFEELLNFLTEEYGS